MNSDLLFDFSVNKENKTVHILREFNAGIELFGKRGQQLNCSTNGGGLNPLSQKQKL